MNELSLCKQEDLVSNNHTLKVEHYYTIQVGISKKTHEKNMKGKNNDDQQVYQWCPLLKTHEWNAYVENPLDDMVRVIFFE